MNFKCNLLFSEFIRKSVEFGNWNWWIRWEH